MVIVLDTDVLSILQLGFGTGYTRLVERLAAAESEMIGVAIITFEEQMRGWLAVLSRAAAQQTQIRAYAKLQSLLDDYLGRPILATTPVPPRLSRHSDVRKSPSVPKTSGSPRSH